MELGSKIETINKNHGYETIFVSIDIMVATLLPMAKVRMWSPDSDGSEMRNLGLMMPVSILQEM